MRNFKAVALLVLAIITGLAAAVYAAGWVAQRGNLASTKVVVAAVDIELGGKINPQMVTQVDWPTGSVPAGAYTDIKEVQDRVVKVGLQRGEAVLDRKLAPIGTAGGLSAVIADGKRAMTVRVNDVVGVAGFALPGNYVDVMVNLQHDGPNNQGTQVSMTVLEHVLVLAVAQEANRDDTKPKVVSAVTLEVLPAEAEKLDLARSVGNLSLVLRNQLDQQAANTNGITRDQLLGIKAAVHTPPAPRAKPLPVATRPAPPVAVVKAPCVEVIRNGVATTSCF